MSFQPILTDSEIGEMKAHLRAMERKRDTLAIQVAKTLNLPSIWTLEMVDWNNPLITGIGDELKQLDCEINELTWDIAEAEAIQENNLDFFQAEKTVYSFLGKLSTEDALSYLKQLGLTTHGLIGKVAENPNFISETYGVKVL